MGTFGMMTWANSLLNGEVSLSLWLLPFLLLSCDLPFPGPQLHQLWLQGNQLSLPAKQKSPHARAACQMPSLLFWTFIYQVISRVSWLPGKHQVPGELWWKQSHLPFLPLVNLRLTQSPLWSHSMSHEHSIMCHMWLLENQPCLCRQMMMWGALLVNSEDCTFLLRKHASFVGIFKDSVHAYSIPGGYF